MKTLTEVLNSLPLDRDLYSAREIAGLMWEIPARLVEPGMSRRVADILDKDDRIGKGSGKLVRWKGSVVANVPERMWVVRNHERYLTSYDESRHLRGLPIDFSGSEGHEARARRLYARAEELTRLAARAREEGDRWMAAARRN